MELRVKYEELENAGSDAGGGEIVKYLDELFTGTIVEYYSDGTLRCEAEFKNGHMDGAQREYFPNGHLKEDYFIRFNSSYGLRRRWDENGNLIEQYDRGPEP